MKLLFIIGGLVGIRVFIYFRLSSQLVDSKFIWV